MFKDYQLYKVYKIPQKQNKKRKEHFFHIYMYIYIESFSFFSSEVLDPEVVK